MTDASENLRWNFNDFIWQCELNADCCSKQCNAANRCIAAIVSGVSVNSSQPASSSLANRFGEENKPCQEVGTNVSRNRICILRLSQKSNHSQCLLGRDCCSGQCSSDTQRCFDQSVAAGPSTGLQGQEALCAKINQQVSLTFVTDLFLLLFPSLTWNINKVIAIWLSLNI